MNKTGWDNKDIYNIGTGLANILLVLSCLILLPYLLAPLFGGSFSLRSILAYGCWIGNALIIKYTMRYVRDKVRMKKQKWFLISLWLLLSILLWLPNYIGLIIYLFLVILLIGGFRGQGRAGWQEERP
jgi:hypothetical protein